MASGKVALSSSKVVNIDDLRRLSRRRLPRAVFDYLDGGAESEITLRENIRGLRGNLLEAAQRGGLPRL